MGLRMYRIFSSICVSELKILSYIYFCKYIYMAYYLFFQCVFFFHFLLDFFLKVLLLPCCCHSNEKLCHITAIVLLKIFSDTSNLIRKLAFKRGTHTITSGKYFYTANSFLVFCFRRKGRCIACQGPMSSCEK